MSSSPTSSSEDGDGTYEPRSVRSPPTRKRAASTVKVEADQGPLAKLAKLELKPLLATLWEDEYTFCYQVCYGKHIISRRQDTNFVNGTKLVNVAELSRGKRHTILKKEKVRSLFKTGAHTLKGVWLPLDAARRITTTLGITALLFPLLETQIEQHLYSPESVLRTSALVDASRHRQRQIESHRAGGPEANDVPPPNEPREKAMRAFLDGMEEQVRTHSEAHAANGVSLVALGTESGKRRAKKGAVTASDFVSSRPPPRRPLSLAAAPDPTPRSTNSPTLSRFSFGTNYEESRGMDWSSGSEASRANPPELATSYPLSATPVPIPMRRQPVADRRHSYPTLSAPSTSNDARRRYSVFHHGCPPAPSAIVQRQWASTSESIPEERQPEFAPRYRYSLTPSSSTESFVSFFGTDRGVGGLSPTSSGLSPAYGGYDACGSEPFSPLYSKSRRDSFQVYLPPPYPPPQYQGQRDDRSQLDPSPPQSQFQHLWTPDPAYAMPLQQQPQSAQEQEHERGRPLSLDMGRAGGEAANSWQWSPDAVDGGGAGAGAAYDYGTSSYRLPTYRPSSASSLSVMDRRGSLIGAVLEPFPPDDLASPEPAWRDARVDDAGAAGSQEESQSRGVRFEEPAVAERRAWSVDHGRPFVYGEDAYSRRASVYF